tara:strand:- start:477 stop:668 length:192 start_codon:yes stop_codon:yes gene_type:complete
MSKKKTDLQVFQEWVQELTGLVFGTEEKPKPKPKKRKRARKSDGTYRGDDKSTPNVNEAWENE